MYAQNPPEKSMFDQNLALADEQYKTLTENEKIFCDLAPRRLAVLHVRKLKGENKQSLIPGEIGVDEDDNAIDLKTAAAVVALQVNNPNPLSDDRWCSIAKISAIRISAPFKKQADAVGQKPTWNFFEQHNFEDPNYFGTSFGNESQQN
jgi:hypothetical protein